MRATMQRVAPAARPTACRASWTDARGGAQGTGAIFSFLFFLLQDLGDSGLVMGASDPWQRVFVSVFDAVPAAGDGAGVGGGAGETAAGGAEEEDSDDEI